MRHISLAIVTLLLATSASAEECLAESHSYEGKVYNSETCTARVDDVIKANADGFAQIDYIVQYRGARLVVEDPVARTNRAVGEQISFWVSKLDMPPDSRSQGFRTLSAQVIVPKPEAKPGEEGCPPSSTTSPGTTTPPIANENQALANGYVSIARDSLHMAALSLDYLHHLQINDVAGARAGMESWLVGNVFAIWGSVEDPRTSTKDRASGYSFLRLIAIQNEKFPVDKWNSDPKLASIFKAAIDNDPAHAALLRRQNWNKPKWVEWVD